MLSKQGQRSGAWCLLRLMVNWIPRSADEITFTPIKNATRVFLLRKPQNNSREENESDRNSFQICHLETYVFLLLFLHGTMLLLCVTIKYWLLAGAFIHTEHMVTQIRLSIVKTLEFWNFAHHARGKSSHLNQVLLVRAPQTHTGSLDWNRWREFGQVLSCRQQDFLCGFHPTSKVSSILKSVLGVQSA